MRKILFYLTHNPFRIWNCNNYPKELCNYKARGYQLKTWHKGQNFIVPACPNCKIGIMI